MATEIAPIQRVQIPLTVQMAAMKKYFPTDQGHLAFKKKFTNPFRNDTHPSCQFAISNTGGNLMFFDYAHPEYSFDCIKLLMLRFDICFKNALNMIRNEFDVEWYESTKDLQSSLTVQNNASSNKLINITKASVPTQHEEPSIYWKIVKRSWNEEDDKFWADRYDISRDLLNRYNIVPIGKAFKRFSDCTTFVEFYSYDSTNNDPCYCYLVDDRVKFYRPYNKRYKWMGNVRKENIQGYTQLPAEGDLLIIAASMKDALCLIAVGFNAIAPQSESTSIPDAIIEELKGRFKQIVILFDNDEAGLASAKKYSALYDIEYKQLIPIPTVNKLKDVADYKEHLKDNDKFKDVIQRSLA